jgi:DNA-binding CsgD family transcriptional regulator
MAEQALASAYLPNSRFVAEAEAQRAWIWLAQADLRAALAWLAARKISADAEPLYERQPEYLMLARIRLAQAQQTPESVDLDAIKQLLDRLYRAAEADTRMSDRIALLALLAALQAQVAASESGAPLLSYIKRLLAAFPPDSAQGPRASPTSLSERERTVLQYLAEGRSIQEIAASMVISAHTARTHVKNIYLKLDAHNRVQALERARALRLL